MKKNFLILRGITCTYRRMRGVACVYCAERGIKICRYECPDCRLTWVLGEEEYG